MAMTESLDRRAERLERELASAQSTIERLRRATPSGDVAELPNATERRYRLLVESSTDVVYITDPQRFRYVSPSVESVLGYRPSELIGRVTFDFVHPDDVPLVADALGEVLASPLCAVRVKFRARHADGSYRVVEVTGRNLLEDPDIRGVVVNLHDVTARDNAEKALVARERQMRGIFDGAADAMLIADDDARYVEVNVAALRLLGLERSEVLGKKTYEVVPHEADHDLYWKDFLARGSTTREITIGSGERRRSFLVRATSNVYPGAHLAVLEELTERRRADQAREDSARRFRMLIESSTDVVCIARDRIFTYVSPAIEHVLGHSAELLLGTDSLGLVHPDDLPAAARIRESFYGTPPQKIATLRPRFRHQDGSYRIVELTVRNFADEPTIGGFVMNFHDVTEQQHAQDKLQRSEATLRESQATLEKAQSLGHLGSWTVDGLGAEPKIHASDETLRSMGSILPRSTAIHLRSRTPSTLRTGRAPETPWAPPPPSTAARSPTAHASRDGTVSSGGSRSRA